MKKAHIFSLFLLLALILNTGGSANGKPTDPSKPDGKNALHEELIAKEKEVWDAYKRKDTKTLGQLLAGEYYAIEDADGQIMSKAEAIESAAELDLKNYEMRNVAVFQINDGSAIVRYKVKIEGAAHKHAFVPQWSMVSSVWVKREGKWQNLMYQETKIGE
jgi:hypothetical protein